MLAKMDTLTWLLFDLIEIDDKENELVWILWITKELLHYIIMLVFVDKLKFHFLKGLNNVDETLHA